MCVVRGEATHKKKQKNTQQQQQSVTLPGEKDHKLVQLTEEACDDCEGERQHSSDLRVSCGSRMKIVLINTFSNKLTSSCNLRVWYA